jgi:hypothetical protein
MFHEMATAARTLARQQELLADAQRYRLARSARRRTARRRMPILGFGFRTTNPPIWEPIAPDLPN